MGLRLTTKVQVSGWRFLLRRLEHAIVRRDTRMFDDPLQFYSRSAMVGVVIAAIHAKTGILPPLIVSSTMLATLSLLEDPSSVYALLHGIAPGVF